MNAASRFPKTTESSSHTSADELSFFARAANAISHAAGRPAAFILSVLIVIVWAVCGPIFHYSDTWQLVINTGTTIVTFLMVFLIQNSQNRDGAALQAKLDELIRVTKEARNDFVGIESKPEEKLEKMREDVKKDAARS
ncbi:MAG TPA: low affinity iron permease family protein [Rhizomicrobium sp.]|nr:low affinity iron permease family protein [Rhizomicrobium sp.]